MAELDSIARIVQLIDVALRVSREIRSFLDAYKDTGRDVNALRDGDSGQTCQLDQVGNMREMA
ncbi:hypothetical protein EJ02DRAFT_356928 [Clathrospora elynae]|uniref:Uncharacterized protein n=1 Tax=Clathrospora elynae TaxID=706981 RepID=A0A6A5SBR7_9PLEO|nr:hypothetical protein EJ02DRAFT_356928 [Clathrospora elynae]